MQTFGLSKDVIPDQAAVHEALDANDQALFDVAQGMADGVRSQINANAAQLAVVDKRLTQSVNGHIRKNVGLLKPVIQGLADSVNIPLDQNQAIINGVVATPEIQDMMGMMPPSPAYDGTIPQVMPSERTSRQQVTLEGAYTPPSAAQLAGGVPTVPAGLIQGAYNWAILIDCEGRQVAALPVEPFDVTIPTFQWPQALKDAEAAGWKFWREGLLPHVDAMGAIAWLQANGLRVLSSCLQ